MANQPVITCVITYHNEPIQWLRRAIASVQMSKDAPDHEIIVIADKTKPENVGGLLELPDGVRVIQVKHGDLGLSRNSAVSEARGRYIQYLDTDDMLGYDWLRAAYEYAKQFDHENFVLHPEHNLMFGQEQFFHRHIGDDSPEFDAKGMIQWNPWSALAFAPKSVFQRFPYEASNDTFMNEDWAFNLTTIAEGITHRVISGGVHFIRLKLDGNSMATRMHAARGVQRKRKWFDRRDLPAPQIAPVQNNELPESVYKQALFAHHEVGEKRIMISAGMQTRVYGPAAIFEDQAWLRDQIGDAKHVVVVETLPGGGAEKYALNWAAAVGAKVIETAPAHALPPDDTRIRWLRRRQLNELEELAALQRALIQSDLDSVLICNSQVGLRVVEDNPKCLAKKVFVASFATIPREGGFSSCPPFWFRRQDGYTVVTDNHAHAAAMKQYNGVDVVVIHPKAAYTGPSKKRQVLNDTARTRVLWAGRGTADKQPQIVAELALVMSEVDFHVWGDVPRVPNALPNLKYRGPFDGFASIDGVYDMYLMTSINEGTPHSAMEATLAGLPVVAPNVGDLGLFATTTYPAQIGRPTNIGAIIDAIKKTDEAPGIPAAKLQAVADWAEQFDDNVKALVLG